MNGPRPRREQLRQEREVVSQRDYFQMQLEAQDQRLSERIVALEKLLQARMDAMQLASDSRRVALDTRLEQMNEIRGQLATQRADFVTTDRLESLLSSGQVERRTFTDKISTLESQLAAGLSLAREQAQKDLDVQRNRMENDFKMVNADIRSLRESRSTSTGSSVTAREFISYGIAALAVVATILSRVLH